MIELTKNERMNILNLCAGEEEEVTLYACIKGYMGRAWVDSKESPTCALALIGDFCYVLGTFAEEQEEEIFSIVSELVKNRFLMIKAEHWERLLNRLQGVYPDSYKSLSRYAMMGNKEWFDKEKLKVYATAIEPEFEAMRIDSGIYPITQEQFWTEDFCSNFETEEEFMKYGIGYVVLRNNEIIAGASTYSFDGSRLEITIETKEEYRKRGLALVCASKIILESLERDIYPRWDAMNLTSVALAEKLGYRYDHEYTVYTF